MARLAATVFGAGGFVGSALVRHLAARDFDVSSVLRGDESWRGRDLGHAFYCIGLTADFRSRPFETIEAHVGRVTEVLGHARFASLVYLSSTRVYARASGTDESAPIPVAPAVADDLYNVSKLMGEAACLGSGRANVRVARLSNVFGAGDRSDNFLTSVVRDAVTTGRVALRTSLASEKDYVWIGDVVAALEAIATRGTDPIVNVAAGANTTHGALMDAIREATGATVTVADGAPTIRFPRIDTQRLDGLGLGPRLPVTAAIRELCGVS